MSSIFLDFIKITISLKSLSLLWCWKIRRLVWKQYYTKQCLSYHLKISKMCRSHFRLSWLVPFLWLRADKDGNTIGFQLLCCQSGEFTINMDIRVKIIKPTVGLRAYCLAWTGIEKSYFRVAVWCKLLIALSQQSCKYA